MRRMIKGHLLKACGALLLLVSGHAATVAQPGLSVEEQPKFTYPVLGSNSNTFDFLLFSTGVEMSGVSVETRQVKNPEGQVLPSYAVKPSLKSNTVSPQGVGVTLEIAPQYFLIPGEYKVILTFKTAGAASVYNPTIIINRTAAEINVEELKDRTVALTRPFPGRAFDHTVSLSLRETSGKSSLSGLEFIGRDILHGGTKNIADGKLTIAAATSPTPQEGAGARLGAATYDLKFTGLSQAGTFDTGVIVKSGGLAGEQVIPLKLRITDLFVWPLMAIGLGVLGGYYFRRIADIDTPRNLNELRILRLRGEVDGFRGMVRRAESIDTLEGLLRRLEEAEEANGLGNFAAATSTLTQIESALSEFRKKEATLEDGAQKSLAASRREIATLEADPAALSADERRELDNINHKLDEAERLLRQGRVEDADFQLESTKLLLDGLTRRRLTGFLSQLDGQLAHIENLADDQKQQAETLKSGIRESLVAGDFGKARAQLYDLNIFIDTLKVRRRGARARGDELMEVTPPLKPVVTPEQTRIQVDTPVGERIANTLVAFTLVDAQGILAPGDIKRWYFGDVASFHQGHEQASHTYSRPGRYQVSVEVMRNDVPFKTLQETITILPGHAQISRALVLDRLRRNEVILSVIALAVAVVTGLLLLYVNKAFGTISDYLLALLWGFGIDNGVKSVADVFAKFKLNKGGA